MSSDKNEIFYMVINLDGELPQKRYKKKHKAIKHAEKKALDTGVRHYVAEFNSYAEKNKVLFTEMSPLSAWSPTLRFR